MASVGGSNFAASINSELHSFDRSVAQINKAVTSVLPLGAKNLEGILNDIQHAVTGPTEHLTSTIAYSSADGLLDVTAAFATFGSESAASISYLATAPLELATFWL